MKASRTRYSIVALAIGLAILSYVQRVAISQAAGPISHDLHLNKAQMGLVFGAFGLSYALFEIPIGLLGDKIGVRRVLLQIVSGLVDLYRADRSSLERRLALDHSLPLRSRRGGLFPHPHPHAQHVAAGARTRHRAGHAVGLCALGRSLHATAGAGLHRAVRLEIFLCRLRLARPGVVRHLLVLVQRQSPAAHLGQRCRKGTARNSRVLMTHHAGQKKWLSLLLTPEVMILCLQYFCVSFTWYFYITWLPTYLREGRGQTAGHAAALSVLPLLFGGFGSLITGLAPVRLPRRRIAFFGLLATALLLFVFLHTQTVLPRHAVHGRGQPVQ